MLRKHGLILAVFFCFNLAGNLAALNLADIRTEVRRQMRDTDATRRRYSDALLLDYINEAQRVVVNATWLSERTTEYTLVANVTYYNLPVDLLAITNVYFKNKQNNKIKLEANSQKALYGKNPDWERQKATPFEYWLSNATSPVVSATSTLKISYIPIPDWQSTGTVTVWYINHVQDLALDTDVPFENRRYLYPYHVLLSYHVTARLKLIERKIDESTVYFNMFNAYLEQMKGRLGEAPDYTPSFGVGKK